MKFYFQILAFSPATLTFFILPLPYDTFLSPGLLECSLCRVALCLMLSFSFTLPLTVKFLIKFLASFSSLS